MNGLTALSDGCRGYLIDLSFGGITGFAPLPENTREITKGLLGIARTGTSYEQEGSEDDESAYAERVEYLRVGVLLINEELQSTRALGIEPGTTLH